MLKETFNEWNAGNVSRLGAALAYYSVFSIAPLVMLVIAAASMIFGKEAANQQIANEIESTVGAPMARAVQEMLKNNADATKTSGVTIIGIFILIVGAAGVFGQLQEALNTAVGAARLAWGRHGPSRSYSTELAKVFDADLTQAQREKIFGGNLRRLAEPIFRKKGFSLNLSGFHGGGAPFGSSLTLFQCQIVGVAW